MGGDPQELQVAGKKDGQTQEEDLCKICGARHGRGAGVRTGSVPKNMHILRGVLPEHELALLRGGREGRKGARVSNVQTAEAAEQKPAEETVSDQGGRRRDLRGGEGGLQSPLRDGRLLSSRVVRWETRCVCRCRSAGGCPARPWNIICRSSVLSI